MRSLFVTCVWAAVLVIAQGAEARAQDTPAESSADSAQEGPRTTAETSQYQRTSLLEDVEAFLGALEGLPFAARLDRRVLGTTAEGRDLPLVVVALEPPVRSARTERLRVVCTGNIHPGEVEGKEALQVLFREFAQGLHGELLEDLELWFVPVFNADGNERIDPRHREAQNGPVMGVGTRGNAAGLDLNRDFVKAETAEVRALLRLWNELDPHVFIDLHTTNGSFHGYHLTYAPSLATNADPGLDVFAREVFLPQVSRTLLDRANLRTQHYGNFGRGKPRSWSTYDHRPRFGTNAFGLRGRFAILSEAYSYLPFQERIEVTHAFVLEVLRGLVQHKAALADACAAADQRALAGDISFGFDSQLVPGVVAPIAVGGVIEVPLGEDRGVRREATDALAWEDMQVRLAFVSREQIPLPRAWVAVAHQEELAAVLERQGIEFEVLQAPREVALSQFSVTDVQRSERPFQGHHEVRVEGAWEAGPGRAPAGALWVPGAQRRARLAAQLLEPQSEDSVATWNLFDAALGLAPDGTKAAGEPSYPVLRAAKGD